MPELFHLAFYPGADRLRLRLLRVPGADTGGAGVVWIAASLDTPIYRKSIIYSSWGILKAGILSNGIIK